MKKKLVEILKEDISRGDVTTALLKPKKVKAFIRVNEDCVLAGVEEAKFLFTHFGCRVKVKTKDGQKVKKRKIIMEVSGNVKKILPVERTALNILGRMSAVATICEKASKIAGNKCRILLTRKTMPGFNLFDKKAAGLGGVLPHRINLNDMMLIKDNHIIAAGGVKKILKKANGKKGKKIEVEVSNFSEALAAAKFKPHIIMLDNFRPAWAKATIQMLRKAGFRGKIELSGGIALNNLARYVSCRADYISMGELTKKAGIVDLHLSVKR